MGRRAWLLSMLVTLASGCASHRAGALARAPYVRHPPGARVLIVFDDGGPYGWLGELYAAGAGTLASHFGPWAAVPSSAYPAGALRHFEAALYVGSTFDQPLPAAFLDDVLAGETPITWLGHNLPQLARHAPDLSARFGFTPGELDRAAIRWLEYQGVRLAPGTGVRRLRLWAGAREGPRAGDGGAGRRDDVAGRSAPHLTFVGENPLAYVVPGDVSWR